jgi:hypothetical protein
MSLEKSNKASLQEEEKEETVVTPINKNKRYRKEKPWDNDPTLDKWKVE